MTREEVKKKIYDKKVKKALRSYRFRPFKNFIFWFAGVLSSVAVVAGTIFVGVKVVPISTYTGGIENEYVSETISSKSIVDALLAFNQYSVADIPGVRDMLLGALEETLITDYITINKEKLNSVKFDFSSGGGEEMVSTLLASISINPKGLVLGDGEDKIDLSGLSIFNEYAQIPDEDYAEKFDADGNIKAGEEEGTLVATPAAYYYDINDQENQPEGQIASMSAASGTAQPKYKRAFDDNGKVVDEIAATAIKGKRLFYPALTDVSAMDIVNMLDMVMDRVKVSELIALFPSDDGGGFIGDILGDASLRDLTSDSFTEKLMNNISLSTFGAELGSISQLKAFSEWEKVKPEDIPLQPGATTIDDDKKDMWGIYYYVVDDKDVDDEGKLNNTAYAPVFKNNGESIELANESITHETEMYYVNLSGVGVMQMGMVVSPRLNCVPATEIISSLGGAEFQDDSLMLKVLGDLTISQIGGLGTTYPIKLSAIIPLKEYDEDGITVLKDNSEIYKILLEATGEAVTEQNLEQLANEFTVDKLNGNFEFNNITLGAFIEGETLDLICSAINNYRKSADYAVDKGSAFVGADINADTICIGDMQDFMPEYIAVSSVMTSLNNDMKELLLQLTGKDGGTGDLDEKFAKITVGDLSDITTDKVKLDTIMSSANATLKAILQEATEEDFANITIAHLSSLNITKVRLATAMGDITLNDTLQTVLSQALKNTPFDQIKISDLGSSSFSLDNVYLDSLMPYGTSNETLYNVLLEATGAKANETNAKALTLGSLKGSFDLGKVSLSTALSGNTDAANNEILAALINKGVKLGNIGTAINDLTLYEIFGKTCFTTNEDEAVKGSTEGSTCMFKFVKDHQVHDENGDIVVGEFCDAFVHISPSEAQTLKDNGEDVYYLHKNDGIWLIMCFEFGHVDRDISHVDDVDYGRPNEYYISDNTLGSLLNSNQGTNNFMSVALTKATLRQLMDAGMINITNKKYYAATITDIISILNNEP